MTDKAMTDKAVSDNPGLPLLPYLARKGNRATALASVICKLVARGAELGELVAVDITGEDGAPRQIKVLPRLWLERLLRALEVGAFERLEVDEIVDRILLPPLPA